MTTTTRENTKKSKRSILIVDDHPVVREGLAKVINNETDLFISGEAWDMPSIDTALKKERPDLIILDVSLSNSSGLDLIKVLNARENAPPILVLSMHDEALYAERFIRLGAKGYITKDEPTLTLLGAIRKVLRGQYYVSNAVISRVFSRMSKRENDVSIPEIEKLSDRELQVLEMMGQGVSTHQIADYLCLSMKTIQTYQKRTKEKLALKSLNDLIRYAGLWVNNNA
ncbi:MAG: response regulator transcription factor [Candidatus Marinimicrobia bacterium]|nr:response regulator transcription factor [Candidatus Neomarinimicrobiota bacterium]